MNYAFRYPDTSVYFGNWVRKCEPDATSVRIPKEAVKDWQDRWDFPDNGWTEYGLSVFYTSDVLLRSCSCVFHAASFLLNGKAYLLTAASGTGKSTQLRNLLSLHPGAARVMNGDKPALGIGADGNVIVYPSPWKGKEGWGDDSVTAPLGGIVILKQGETDSVRKTSLREAVPFLMSRFLFSARTRESVLAAASMEERLLQSVPVLTFTNTGTEEGSEVLFKALNEEV